MQIWHQFSALDPVWLGAMGAVLGAIIGSFIAALVSRWPKGQSVVRGRSHCDACGETLRYFELVPILSWIVQRGRCRRCAAAIGADALWVEALAAAIGAMSLGLLPLGAGLAGALFGWMLLALAWLDLRHFWLPNWLVLPLAIAGLTFALFQDAPSLVDALVGGVAGYGALGLIAWGYRQARGREGLGQGDPKMLGAIGLWLGWQMLPFVLLGASAIGLGVALARWRSTTITTRFALGTLMAVPAFTAYLVLHGGWGHGGWPLR